MTILPDLTVNIEAFDVNANDHLLTRPKNEHVLTLQMMRYLTRIVQGCHLRVFKGQTNFSKITYFGVF
jgi:hypothetical protein